MESLDVLLADLLHGAFLFSGTLEDFVVDISEVLHEGDCVTPPDQIATQHIPGDVAAGMAEMAEVVDRDAAAVDADVPVLERSEGFRAAGEGVCEPQ